MILTLLALVGAYATGAYIHGNTSVETKEIDPNATFIRINVTPFVTAYHKVTSWFKTKEK
jgi:hypothetical protein